MMFDAFLPFDGAAAQWLAEVFNPGSNPFWDSFFTIITRFGDGGLLIALLSERISSPYFAELIIANNAEAADAASIRRKTAKSRS